MQRQADLFDFETSLVYKGKFQDNQDCYTDKPYLDKPGGVGGVFWSICYFIKARKP